MAEGEQKLNYLDITLKVLPLIASLATFLLYAIIALQLQPLEREVQDIRSQITNNSARIATLETQYVRKDVNDKDIELLKQQAEETKNDVKDIKKLLEQQYR